MLRICAHKIIRSKQITGKLNFFMPKMECTSYTCGQLLGQEL